MNDGSVILCFVVLYDTVVRLRKDSGVYLLLSDGRKRVRWAHVTC